MSQTRTSRMRKITGQGWIGSIALIMATSIVTVAQNLVVNPSFEQTLSNCGNFGGEGFGTDLIGTWDNANSNPAGDSCSSPDLFSVCNEIFGISVTGMPDNELGWQQARTGSRYAGIITHEALGSNYREYIQGRTNAPLVAGEVYCVSFFVSKGDNVPFATNNMGVYFSNTQYLRNACPGNSLINEVPQLNYACEPLVDTANWVRLQWNYVAEGGEQFFVIGNFFTNSNTQIVNTGNGSILNPYAYYYIDDVSITLSENCCYADIDAPDSVCVDDAVVNLDVLLPNGLNCTVSDSGYWSGPGITDTISGFFNPALAGVGVHTINFTLSCGYVASRQVNVKPCDMLIVCLNEEGDIAVGGGPGPYMWQYQDTIQDCSGCPFGLCIPPICAGVSVLVWDTLGFGPTIALPTVWPIRVISPTGAEVIIAGHGQLVSCSDICQLSVTISDVTNICAGSDVTTGAATAIATGGLGVVQFEWNTTPISQSSSVSNLSAGDYIVIVTDIFGCSDTAEARIDEYPEVIAFVGSDTVICLGDTIQLTASGGSSYLWNTGDSVAQISIAPVVTTQFDVLVIGEGACSDSAGVLIVVDERICLGIVPNVFNPDTDFEGIEGFCAMVHQNNTFQLPCLELYPGNRMRIFDRWGRERYDETNYHLNPWDGDGASDGVYYFVLEVPNIEAPLKGYFHIAH
jgi:hypothetical protein